MIFTAVADTHAALWYLFDVPRLSTPAKAMIEQTALARNKIAISSISLAELVYLIEKGRIAANTYDDLRAALADPEHVFAEAVFSGDIVQSMRKVSRSEVPDMPDRIIAATAIHLGVSVLSRDNRIRASSVRTVW